MRKLLAVSVCMYLCVTQVAFGFQSSKGTISEPSQLLDGRKAVAHWTWNSGEQNPKNTYLLFRKTVDLNECPDSVVAYISAAAVADVYVNSKLVDRCPMNCDPEYQVYEKFDLTHWFQKGENVISAVVYNFGIGMHHRIPSRGGFFFQGKAILPDHSVVDINTDGSWLVSGESGWDSNTDLRTAGDASAPNLIGFIERFDARKADAGWMDVGFEDSGWERASVIGIPPIAPWNNIVMVERPILFREEVRPVDHWYLNGWVVYDFGTEVTGVPVIRLNTLEEGTDITIGTAERLLPDGTPDFHRRVNYEDHYITRMGDQEWNPFAWRGFRYVTMPVNSSIIIESISAVNRHFSVEDAGQFECSDPLLNRIWNAGRLTMKWCCQDTYMDTPWREQTQYIAGDSRYLQQYAFYTSGMSSEFLTRYNILSGAWSQRWMPDGSIRSRYPTDWLLGEGTSAYLVDYELEWILMVGEYYRLFGREDLVKQVYPNLEKLMTRYESLIGKAHGVLSDVPGWIVLDHPDTYPMDEQKEITALNCLYYGALNQASWLAREVMDDPENAQIWSDKARQLKNNIQKWLRCPIQHLYFDSYGSTQFSQQTQVYALLYGLVEKEDQETVIEYITSQDRHSEQSFAYYVVGSVFDTEEQWALDYIRKYWGGQMQLPTWNGGWHEGWNIADWGDIGSTSHAWCSGPTAILPQKVLGVEPVKPGWKVFRIKPHPGDLQWARGIVPSPFGDIAISWTRGNDQVNLTVVVPEGTSALIKTNDQGEVRVSSGTHRFSISL
ncbi:MAG: glycoside hydrolase family 78 protein [Bacteroidales bacterium]|nr:glycoside hydrolase family 78 protein [Bacteroidales bacterium]MDD2571646.1 family 78 glycoside hydrolase catalytic domain [Bacteroidales bacterium]MDD3386237.1 family 78 glycoside hydrolase catalytic domain [Bacteroidales bacterium]MDD3812728.1 family 78 glycoside hydrolase catalytic domain [Bacteroidales bacterium]MDD3872562.1 family 78 glycoside hydrolase catalytic domain [Bacteroidales bacterium]